MQIKLAICKSTRIIGRVLSVEIALEIDSRTKRENESIHPVCEQGTRIICATAVA
jgi:hypothetical protein